MIDDTSLLKANGKNSSLENYVPDRTYRFLGDLIKDFELSNSDEEEIRSYVYKAMDPEITDKKTWIKSLNHKLDGKLLSGNNEKTLLYIKAMKDGAPREYNIMYFTKSSPPVPFILIGERLLS